MMTDKAVLERRVVAGDSSLYPVVRAHAESVKAAQSKGAISRQVKRFLITHLAEKNISIEAAAGYCCVSVRTLQRKLKEEASRYQSLVDETRYQLAAYYLKSTQLTLEQIADRVGYLETTSFYHAFKQWSGQTPSAYRQTNQPSQPLV
ncbi:hypothetical protein CF392_11955 [Tamilnaduibacter salinus]|uniref:HTH araC/xylS-type domain-containing protein n=1 Tax=Tamilnaduibacter salinus TaxID=1484056 RepID=A0A2A2I1H1_9GAMM|nr:hypothetical protein CF392_11955 [Tamilnaduibacter salinus]